MIYIQNSNIWARKIQKQSSIKIIVYKSYPFSFILQHDVFIRGGFLGMFNFVVYEDFCFFKDLTSEWGHPRYIYKRSRQVFEEDGTVSHTFVNEMLDKHKT
jgi:hypothetical protein